MPRHTSYNGRPVPAVLIRGALLCSDESHSTRVAREDEEVVEAVWILDKEEADTFTREAAREAKSELAGLARGRAEVRRRLR